MRRPPVFLFCFILFPCFLIYGTYAADSYMDDSRIGALMRAQDFLFDDRFDAADSIYTAMINESPRDPAGYIFRAGGLLAQMNDREENLRGALFSDLLDSVEIFSEAILDTCNDRTAAWMHLFRGHSRAYRSLWEARFGSVLKALRVGLSSNDEYERGLICDSSLYDLYAGLGSYHYWKSSRAGLLRTLGLFRNEKERGITELYLAVDSSVLHRESAHSALAWVWLDRDRYDSVIAIASDFAARYDKGKTFLWPLAQAYYLQEDYQHALEIYRMIRSRLLDCPGNYFNLIECDYYICQCHNWLLREDRAIAAARRIHEYRDLIPDKTFGRQRSKVRFLERMATRETRVTELTADSE